MKKIGIDVDGVLRDVMQSINTVFETHYPEHIVGKIAYNYDFPHIKMPLKEKFNVIFNDYPEEIFLNSQPYPGAVEQFAFLKKWAKKNGFKLVCATNQEPHLIGLTYMWLAKHDFLFEELHIARKKEIIGLDYLIDDAPHNFEAWLKAGHPGENFFLMDRSWNQEVEASIRIKEIKEICSIIL